MAKVKVKFDPIKASKRITRIFEQVVSKNQAVHSEMGKVVVDTIAFQARRGRPLNDTRSFPGLAEATIDARRRLGRLNRTHPSFDPRRSNLTLTGQLIAGLKFEFVRARGETFVFTSGKRKPYRTGEKRSAKITPENSRNEILDRILREKGFKLFTTKGVMRDTVLKNRIKQIAKRALRRALRFANRG